MSWMQKLYDTYENCVGTPISLDESNPLIPLHHTLVNAHIEITIDTNGNFLRAKALNKIPTIIPVTPKSLTGRTSGCAPYPLAEKVHYLAGDYEKYGGQKALYFEEFLEQLEEWCASTDAHFKAEAVLRYVKHKCVISDLIHSSIMHIDDKGNLQTTWDDPKTKPDLFKFLGKKEIDQGDALVRWAVEIPGEPDSATWNDRALINAWMRYEETRQQSDGLCFVTGKHGVLANKHPKSIHKGANNAKLVSSNDDNGYTYRGRFSSADQACGVSTEASQKAHSALRWLILRQGSINNEQAIVAWAVSGVSIPDPLANTAGLMEMLEHEFGESVRVKFEENQITEKTESSQYIGDVGQTFALQLNKCIAGYSAKLDSTENIVVMAVDSVVPGRMAITFYRELTGSEFLERIEHWHSAMAWPMPFKAEGSNSKKTIWRVCAPAPKEIAEACYGTRLDDKLKKATVERLLPCIVDARLIPRDLLESAVRRATNRLGRKYGEWNKNLSIACALFKGYHLARGYKMALEPDRNTRDYLYGRLLAIAEHIEERALYLSGEQRESTAARLMQRFADRPYSTWRTIEPKLTPYKIRLQAKRPAFLFRMKQELDKVMDSFVNPDEFAKESTLTGEFLLGYHCQRQALHSYQEDNADQDAANKSTDQGDSDGDSE